MPEKDMLTYRLKCDHCKRIIESKFKSPIRCMVCAHGTLYVQHPKNHCDTCGAPIFDNVSGPPVRVTCGDCVQRRLLYFSTESKALGQTVREARKKNRWSQRTFALAMECSQQYIDQIEKGEKKPTLKIREFLLSGSATKQTTCEED